MIGVQLPRLKLETEWQGAYKLNYKEKDHDLSHM